MTKLHRRDNSRQSRDQSREIDVPVAVNVLSSQVHNNEKRGPHISTMFSATTTIDKKASRLRAVTEGTVYAVSHKFEDDSLTAMLTIKNPAKGSEPEPDELDCQVRSS